MYSPRRCRQGALWTRTGPSTAESAPRLRAPIRPHGVRGFPAVHAYDLLLHSKRSEFIPPRVLETRPISQHNFYDVSSTPLFPYNREAALDLMSDYESGMNLDAMDPDSFREFYRFAFFILRDRQRDASRSTDLHAQHSSPFKYLPVRACILLTLYGSRPNPLHSLCDSSLPFEFESPSNFHILSPTYTRRLVVRSVRGALCYASAFVCALYFVTLSISASTRSAMTCGGKCSTLAGTCWRTCLITTNRGPGRW